VKKPFFMQKLDQRIDDLNRALKSDGPNSMRAAALHGSGKVYEKKQ